MAEINSFHERNRQWAKFCPFFQEKEIVSFQQRQYNPCKDLLEKISFVRNEILIHQSTESGPLIGRVAWPKRMRLKPVLFASAATTVLFYFLNWPVKLLHLQFCLKVSLIIRLYFHFI